MDVMTGGGQAYRDGPNALKPQPTQRQTCEDGEDLNAVSFLVALCILPGLGIAVRVPGTENGDWHCRAYINLAWLSWRVVRPSMAEPPACGVLLLNGDLGDQGAAALLLTSRQAWDR